MSCFHIASVLSCLLLLGSGISSVVLRDKRDTSGHWGYEEHNGPETWAGICQTGTEQSPIDIDPGLAEEWKFPQLELSDEYLTPVGLRAVNNGHTLSVALDSANGTELTLTGGGLDGQFIFQQLHFHWGAEHLLGGNRAVLEMHLVHYNSKYEDIGEAASQHDGLAVIGVLFDETQQPDEVVEKFLENVWSAAGGAHETSVPAPEDVLQNDQAVSTLAEEYALRNLLPEEIGVWYRYQGSLTTPGCDESVTWTVMENTLPVSSKTIELFRSIRAENGKILEENFRPVQKLNDRKIYIHIDRAVEDVDENEENEKPKISNKGAMLVLSNYLLLLFCIYRV